MRKEPEHKPQGALLQNDGNVSWRVWAPLSDKVSLVLFLPDGRQEAVMTPEGHGHFVHQRRRASGILRYMYKLADGREYPDPASRWQPEGVHRPSALFFPESYTWSDKG